MISCTINGEGVKDDSQVSAWFTDVHLSELRSKEE